MLHAPLNTSKSKLLLAKSSKSVIIMNDLMNKFLAEKEKKWQNFEEKYGKELCDALKEWHALYTDEVVEWLAKLYDAKIGGFYYSESARDNATVEYRESTYDLLPDVESTNQALCFLQSANLVDDFDGSYAKALPEWMKKDIGNWVYNLQDEDGFYYHPQWGKNIPAHRRGRDLAWSRSILRNLGIEPKYASLIDKKKSSVQTNTPAVPEHLSSPEKFDEFLRGLDFGGHSYGVGNQLVAQADQIKAVGLMDQLIAFLNEKQHPENGYWHDTPGYTAVNGLLKISGCYNIGEAPFPNATVAAKSAIEAITSDEEFFIVCDVYNTWFTVDNLADNLRKYGGEEGKAQAEKMISDLTAVAAEGMRASAKKLSKFKKPGCSFSFLRDYSSEVSQSMPVALYHSTEGDVNATLIAVSGTLEKCMDALGVKPEDRVPIFGRPHFERFMEIVTENKRKAEN